MACRPRLEQVNAVHHDLSLPAVLGRFAFARIGALAPARKAFGAGAGDEARTRDVLLGKEVLYH